MPLRIDKTPPPWSSEPQVVVGFGLSLGPLLDARKDRDALSDGSAHGSHAGLRGR
jgi:hypothetical protein